MQCAVGYLILHIAPLEVNRARTAVHSILVKTRISPSGHGFFLPSRKSQEMALAMDFSVLSWSLSLSFGL